MVELGAALSVYQHFGVCNCDLPNTEGALHAYKYREDLELAKRVGLDVLRSGVEWALLFPKPDKVDWSWTHFFKAYSETARGLGLKLWLTLHHFTNPMWLHEVGGWTEEAAVKHFLKYVEFVVEQVPADLYILFNEPTTYATMAYLTGLLPPYKQYDILSFRRALDNIIYAIQCARDVAKERRARVGYAHLMWLSKGGGILGRLLSKLLNDVYWRVVDEVKDVDVVGVNFYATPRLRGIQQYVDISAESLENAVRGIRGRFAITETGIPCRDDRAKEAYLAMILDKVGDSAEAVIWWSFLHGYEWGLGYEPFFAMIDVLPDGTRIVTDFAKSIRKAKLRRVELPKGIRDDWRWYLARRC